MKEFIKHNPATLDNVETMANAMIESMRFVDNTLDYPEAEKARPNDGVEPEWFYDAYYGAIPTSELTAIIQYTQQRMLFENIGETFLGIAFVEMKHFDRLGDFIGQLGGRVNTPKYSSSAVTVEYQYPGRKRYDCRLSAVDRAYPKKQSRKADTVGHSSYPASQ